MSIIPPLLVKGYSIVSTNIMQQALPWPEQTLTKTESNHKRKPLSCKNNSLPSTILDQDYPPSCTSSGCILQLCKVSSVSVHSWLEGVVLTRHMDRRLDGGSQGDSYW